MSSLVNVIKVEAHPGLYRNLRLTFKQKVSPMGTYPKHRITKSLHPIRKSAELRLILTKA